MRHANQLNIGWVVECSLRYQLAHQNTFSRRRPSSGTLSGHIPMKTADEGAAGAWLASTEDDDVMATTDFDPSIFNFPEEDSLSNTSSRGPAPPPPPSFTRSMRTGSSTVPPPIPTRHMSRPCDGGEARAVANRLANDTREVEPEPIYDYEYNVRVTDQVECRM